MRVGWRTCSTTLCCLPVCMQGQPTQKGVDAPVPAKPEQTRSRQSVTQDASMAACVLAHAPTCGVRPTGRTSVDGNLLHSPRACSSFLFRSARCNPACQQENARASVRSRHTHSDGTGFAQAKCWRGSRVRAPVFDALAAPSAASSNFSASNRGCAHTWHM